MVGDAKVPEQESRRVGWSGHLPSAAVFPLLSFPFLSFFFPGFPFIYFPLLFPFSLPFPLISFPHLLSPLPSFPSFPPPFLSSLLQSFSFLPSSLIPSLSSPAFLSSLPSPGSLPLPTALLFFLAIPPYRSPPLPSPSPKVNDVTLNLIPLSSLFTRSL